MPQNTTQRQPRDILRSVDDNDGRTAVQLKGQSGRVGVRVCLLEVIMEVENARQRYSENGHPRHPPGHAVHTAIATFFFRGVSIERCGPLLSNGPVFKAAQSEGLRGIKGGKILETLDDVCDFEPPPTFSNGTHLNTSGAYARWSNTSPARW